MTSLENIVLPLAESRALAEAGIVLDTALSWYEDHHVQSDMESELRYYVAETVNSDATRDRCICGAWVLSELLDAIRDAAHPVFLGVDGLFWSVRWIEPSNGIPLRERSTSEQNDLLAAYALLLEVAK